MTKYGHDSRKIDSVMTCFVRGGGKAPPPCIFYTVLQAASYRVNGKDRKMRFYSSWSNVVITGFLKFCTFLYKVIFFSYFVCMILFSRSYLLGCFKNNCFSSSVYSIKSQMFCIINSHCAKFQKFCSTFRVSQGTVSDFHYFLYKYLYSLTVEL